MPAGRRFAAPFVVTLAVVPACAPSAPGAGTGGPPSGGPQVEHRGDGTCWQHFDASCPPDATCNPPPPRQVDCATGEPLPVRPVPEPEIGTGSSPSGDAGTTTVVPQAQPDAGSGPGYTVHRRADNSCWKHVDVSCPTGATCNPPPPIRVDCETHEPVEPVDEPRR